ncbi:hypothetical protein Btru_038468, partial [Bulinus truncatus]
MSQGNIEMTTSTVKMLGDTNVGPVQPSRFISKNVNIMRGGSNFTFICGRHKDVNPDVPYVVSIRSMNGKTLSSTSVKSTTNFTFSCVTCEDMGTYWCETKTQTDSKLSQTELIVHFCPPLLVHTEETDEVVIGNSLYFTVNATMFERMNTVTVIYQTHSQTNNKCGDKLCADKLTINKWMQQINITIKNITQQDFGNQTVKLCTETVETNYCSDFYLNIVSTAVYCPELIPPVNGRMNGSSTSYDSVITFACNKGYKIVGSQERTCQTNGTWSGQEATCVGTLRVAFKTALSNQVKVHANQTVIYDAVIFNVGGGYNQHTGVFTVPE